MTMSPTRKDIAEGVARFDAAAKPSNGKYALWLKSFHGRLVRVLPGAGEAVQITGIPESVRAARVMLHVGSLCWVKTPATVHWDAISERPAGSLIRQIR